MAAIGGAAALWLAPASALAADIQVSIGVRETGTTADIGDDGGVNNGIEWIDRDLNNITLDGTWQLVTFDLANPNSVLAFAGATADSILAAGKGTLEHIRLKNADGITDPITLWLDDLVVVEATGAPHPLGWEGLTLGSEHILQEPGFSGSTIGNLVDAGTSAVTDSMAHTGTQSYQLDLQFVDNDPNRWARVTTFASVGFSGGNPTIDLDGELSFWIKGVVVPEPASLSLLALAAPALLRRRA
jgi:hypothetical protein